MDINQNLARELSVQLKQVEAAVLLLDEGATVPFVARYRKEATGGLDDTQLRTLESRLRYLRELEQRRHAILKSIEEQGKLSDELREAIEKAEDKASLEDIYLPYKPKRRTKAQIAREAGLEPLALQLLSDPSQDPKALAESFIDAEKQVPDVAAALEGAKQILMEMFSEHAELTGKLREKLNQEAKLQSRLVEEKREEAIKFRDYFEYEESLKTVPSHRALALLRGQQLGYLRLSLVLAEDDIYRAMIAQQFEVSSKGRPADAWLAEVVNWAWKTKIFVRLELDLMSRLREMAEKIAIDVFAQNLKDLLMASPAGIRATMGLDPGFRTGVKVAVVDKTGKLVDHAVIFPHQPQNQWQAALQELGRLCQKHQVELISIGNGTASRETDKLAMELIKLYPQLQLTKIVVSEAGASVYSASELAAQEFPDLDVSYRGAVSIARRLQDPLAELVKIDPKSIGVGQYQHDVNQTALGQSLDAVVEDCVNAVGVEVNTASVALLARVSGLNQTIANNIVAHRDKQGAFKDRQELKKIPRLGDKAFEQAAGFLRIVNGSNPLDASAVHPEAYPVVEKILAARHCNMKDIMGNTEMLRALNAADYTDTQFGLPTVKDILQELEKPGRDPRPAFVAANFKEGVETIDDLKVDMILEGVITNVANFGAFVDIGVHQDGLVHKSAMANYFVKEPRDIVKVGDIVKVKVTEVDKARKRISLTMRLDDSKKPLENKATSSVPLTNKQRKFINKEPPKNDGLMADAFRNAFNKAKD
jgi:uncharacterized protein